MRCNISNMLSVKPIVNLRHENKSTKKLIMKRSILTALIALMAAICAQAQNITVHGTVYSKTDNEPLIGASVMSEIKSANGAATDFDG